MNKKNILLLTIISIIFSGCFATTSNNLKKHNLMDKFEVNKNFQDAAEYTYQMMEVCKQHNIQTYEKKIFDKLDKAEVNSFGKISAFGGTNYWTNINFEKIDETKSLITIYTYVNNEGSRNAVKSVKDWLINNSKECNERAFF